MECIQAPFTPMAGRIQALLSPACVALELKSRTQSEALVEIASLLKTHPAIHDFDAFFHKLLARDALDTTCLGNGLALPHARSESVTQVAMAVGRATEGIRFDNGREAVHLIFVLGTPEEQPMEYLKIVGLLCRILKSDTNRRLLLQAATPEEFVQCLAAAEEQLLVPAGR